MSDSIFTKEVKTGFAMLKMKRPPTGFHEIHLTVSVDEDKKSALEEVWRLPHFTLIEMDWMGSSVTTHVYIRSTMNGYELVNKDGTAVFDPGKKLIPACEALLTQGAVTWALQNPERFVWDVA